MSTAVTWKELFVELRARRAEQERWLDEHVRDLKPGDGLDWYRPMRILCERVALLGSSGLLTYEAALRGTLPTSLEHLRRFAAVDDPETLMWALTHLSLCRAIGVDVDAVTSELAVRVIRDLGKLADHFVDTMRFHALSIAVDYAVLDAAGALGGGAPIERTIEPGAVFQLNAQGFFRYLASAISAGAPREATEPAFASFVACFPHKLAAESLGFEHLFHAACAQVRIANFPPRATGDALYMALTGELPPPPELRELAPDEVAADMRGAVRSYDWESLLATVPAGSDERLATLRGLASAMASAPPGESIGPRLLTAAELLARVGITEGPDRAKSVTRVFAGAMGRAVDELQSGRAGAITLLGLVANVNVTGCVCAPTPPGFFEALQPAIVENLVDVRNQLDEELRALVGLFAINSGRVDFARAAVGPTNAVFRPGRTFDNATSLVGYLANALQGAGEADDVRPACETFVETTPQRLAKVEFPWLAAMLVHRAFVTRFAGGRDHVVAEQLHARVRLWAMARAQAEAEAERARVDPAAWWAIALFDLHGLYPGHTIHLKRSGEAWIQHTQGYSFTRRFHTRIPDAVLNQLNALLLEHDLRRVSLPARNGLPDEASPSITLGAPGGTFTVMKWANDVDPAFDAVHRFLLAAAKFVVERERPFFEGPYDHAWRPF